jgi:hypothetical protein
MKFERQDQREWSRMEGQTEEVGSENLMGVKQEYSSHVGRCGHGYLRPLTVAKSKGP